MKNKQSRGGAGLKRFVGVSLLIASSLSGAMAWAQPAKEDEVRQKYRQAASFASEKKYNEARKLFLELWNKTKTYDVAASLGQIEMVTQHYPEAAGFLHFAVTNFPPHQPEKQLEGLKAWLADVKKRVATLEITTNTKGATVYVDGSEVGQSPLREPLFLLNGKHLIMAAADGYRQFDKSVELVEGGEVKLELTLQADTKSTPASLSPASTNGIVVQPFQGSATADAGSVTASNPNPLVLVSGGVVTVGGVVTGLIFNAKANDESDKANRLSDTLGENACFSESSSACKSLKQHREDHDLARNVSSTAFVVGGAALVGTAVYWLWPRSKPQGSASVRVDGVVAKGSSWLGVSGNF
jgi:hypothetical protein